MRKLLKELKYYKKETVLGPFFKLVEATLELLVPLLVAAIIDNGIANRDTAYTLKYCAFLGLLGLLGFAFSVSAQYFAAKAATGLVTRVRHNLFEHIGKLSYTELDSIGTPTLITRITSDVNQVQNGVNLTLRLLLRSPFVVFGAMIMAFTIDVKSALIFVVTIPVLSAAVFGIMLVSIPLYEKARRKLDKVTETTRENIIGVRVIRAFCREDNETATFKQENELLTSAQKLVGRVSALLNPLTFILINIAVIVLIYVGAIRVESGIITVGMVVALYNYMSQILVELIKLADLIINITKSVACGKRIEAVLEITPSMKNGDKTVSECDIAVEFANVSLKYKTAGAESISNINLSVKSGQTVGIIGGTGAGKTSLINLIPRFYDATVGEVRVFGENVKNYDLESLRNVIGTVPQKAVLFSGTVRENLLWGNPLASDTEIFEALKIAQADDIITSFSDGLDHIISQGGVNLSGGQRQRLTVARALVKNPKILILDDSASALDLATDAALRKALKSLKDTTVFIISQRTASIMHADKILVLEDGKTAGKGSHKELIENCEVYREIYESQFGTQSITEVTE